MLEKLDGETFCVREFRWFLTREGMRLIENLEQLTVAIGEEQPNPSRDIVLASCEMVSLIKQIGEKEIPVDYNFLSEGVSLPENMERPLLSEDVHTADGFYCFVLPRVFFKNLKIIKKSGMLDTTEIAIEDVLCFAFNTLRQVKEYKKIPKTKMH